MRIEQWGSDTPESNKFKRDNGGWETIKGNPELLQKLMKLKKSGMRCIVNGKNGEPMETPRGAPDTFDPRLVDHVQREFDGSQNWDHGRSCVSFVCKLTNNPESNPSVKTVSTITGGVPLDMTEKERALREAGGTGGTGTGGTGGDQGGQGGNRGNQGGRGGGQARNPRDTPLRDTNR